MIIALRVVKMISQFFYQLFYVQEHSILAVRLDASVDMLQEPHGMSTMYVRTCVTRDGLTDVRYHYGKKNGDVHVNEKRPRSCRSSAT